MVKELVRSSGKRAGVLQVCGRLRRIWCGGGAGEAVVVEVAMRHRARDIVGGSPLEVERLAITHQLVFLVLVPGT